MTIDTYMQYLGAFAFTFLVLFIVALGLWFFICLVRGKLPVPLPPQPDCSSIADISSISQLQQKDEEISNLREALRPFAEKSYDCGGRHILGREDVPIKWLLDARDALKGTIKCPDANIH